MTADKTDSQDKVEEPVNKPKEGEIKKVDTEAQEDAAKDRKDTGGYQ